MSKFENLVGQHFGYLTVIQLSTKPHKRTYWDCICKCGKSTTVAACDLKAGHTLSCGCKKFESHNAKHLMKHTRIYDTWCCMNQRCTNKNNKSYKNYGGRGISVCDEWKHDFLAFYHWAMANGYSDELSIDRIDNNGNYSPDNCRWVDFDTQVNNRRTNIRIVHDGKDLTLAQWCKANQMIYSKAWERHRKALRLKGYSAYEDIFY